MEAGVELVSGLAAGASATLAFSGWANRAKSPPRLPSCSRRLAVLSVGLAALVFRVACARLVFRVACARLVLVFAVILEPPDFVDFFIARLK